MREERNMVKGISLNIFYRFDLKNDVYHFYIYKGKNLKSNI